MLRVSKDAENLREVHVDEQDRVDHPERRTRGLGPSLPDELMLWKCAFQRRHDIWYLVHRLGELLGRVLGFFVRVSQSSRQSWMWCLVGNIKSNEGRRPNGNKLGTGCHT